VTTPAAVLTASTSSGTLTGATASLATLTAADALGAAILGLLNEASGQIFDEAGNPILDESGG
jgi:hypothetical protein